MTKTQRQHRIAQLLGEGRSPPRPTWWAATGRRDHRDPGDRLEGPRRAGGSQGPRRERRPDARAAQRLGAAARSPRPPPPGAVGVGRRRRDSRAPWSWSRPRRAAPTSSPPPWTAACWRRPSARSRETTRSSWWWTSASVATRSRPSSEVAGLSRPAARRPVRARRAADSEERTLRWHGGGARLQRRPRHVRRGALDARGVGRRGALRGRRRRTDAAGRPAANEVLVERALAAGARGCAVVDARREMAEEFCAPALLANARYEGKYPLVSALSRPVIVRHLVAEARRARRRRRRPRLHRQGQRPGAVRGRASARSRRTSRSSPRPGAGA